MRVRAEFDRLASGAAADLEKAKVAWLKPDLAKKLQEGFTLKVKAISSMEEYDLNQHKVIAGLLHEDGHATVMRTTVYFRAEVARSLFEVHKDWNRVQNVICDNLSNTNSRRTAQRWVICARDIDHEVMAHIRSKPKGKEFPLHLIDGNPYLTGKEGGIAALGNKVPVEWQKAAIDGYFLQRDQGCNLSADNFKK